MEDVQTAKAPVHLWIVGVLALLWNSWGGYDYLMTKTRNMDYLAGMMPAGVDANAMLAWIEGFPIYAQIGWGLGVWGGVAGSLLLLLRSRWAVTAFLLSLIGMALSFGYQAFGTPMPHAGDIGIFKYFPVLIVLVGAALLYYSHRQKQAGVLR